MLRKIILHVPHSGLDVLLPVTPDHYEIGHGQRIELVNIHQLGDVSLAGTPTLCTVTMDLLLPCGPRTYSIPDPKEPEWYLWHLRQWVDEKTLLRFIVSDTYINLPVWLEDFRTGERDGTNDVYCTVTLREYRDLSIQQTNPCTQNTTRAVESPPATAQQYVVQSGDCLSRICRQFYGDGTAAIYNKLAAYNGIKNPHLIYPGQVVQLPPLAQL